MSTRFLLGASVAVLACVAPQTAGADERSRARMGEALSAIHAQAVAQRDLRAAEEAAAAEAAPGAVEDAQGVRADDIVLGRVQAGDQTLYLGPTMTDGMVRIEAVASGEGRDLAAAMEAMGARDVSARGRMVSAVFPADRLADLADSTHLAFARPSLASTDVGLTTSQGDRSMRTDVLRKRLRLDGSGVTYGVLSDSFECATVNDAGGPFTTQADDIASGDIPADINNLADIAPAAPPPDEGCIDEGRGMAQLIFDVAPGSKIAFHTAFNGQADFANGIIELALAGSDVIVDDVIYFAEPMFQDGVIAQAADEVNRLGVPYYSSNGNRGRDALQDNFRPVADTVGGIFGKWHDFDEGRGVDLLNTVTLDGSVQTNLTFQWDSPNFSVSGAPGARNDVDVVMFDEAGVPVDDCFDADGVFVPPANGLCQFQFTDGGVPIDGGAGGDAIELVSLVDLIGGSTVQIGFVTESGRAPGFFKYVLFGGGFAGSEHRVIGDGSGFGHNNAAGAEGVGASGFFYTEEFIGDAQTVDLRGDAGEPQCVPACLNDFSSAGGTPILFDVEGNRLHQPEVRFKPGITGPDGANTTFFRVDTFRDDDDGDGNFESFEEGEFPNFFGTSASAPHVAAVAGLLIDDENSQIVLRNGRFQMCRPFSSDDESSRRYGQTRRVRADRVAARVERGWLLGPCDRTEPADIRRIMRETAQDMSVRADLTTGETIQVFDEIGPEGFDFDSGFGFVDAVAALEQFRAEMYDDGDDH